MPYDETTGRITAPVSVDDVRRALGIGLDEPGALDVGTLCCSDKINPYSLIRPTFYLDEAGTRPGEFVPSFFQNEREIAYLAPKSQSALSTGGECSKLDIASKYKGWVGSGNNYWYAAKRWGYIVPYVNNVANIPAFVNLQWLTFTPKDAKWEDADNGTRIQNETWCVLDQFDGYLHTARPADPLAGSSLEYGEPVRFTGIAPTGNWKPTDVLDKSGLGNPGGVLSAAAVFGDFDTAKSYYYGATLYTMKSGESEFKFSKIALNAKAVGDTTSTGDVILQDTYIGVLKECREALLIPWILEGKAHVEGNLLISDQATPLKFYPMTFGDGLGFLHANVEPKLITVAKFEFTKTDTAGYTCRITVRFENMRANYPLVVKNAKIYIGRSASGTAYDPRWGDVVVQQVKDQFGIVTNLGAETVTATITFASVPTELTLTFSCSDDNHLPSHFATQISVCSTGAGISGDHIIGETTVPIT